MKKTIATIVVMLLSGCATQPEKNTQLEKNTIDITPKNPTVVLKASGVISGMILPDATFKQITYTRNDKRSLSNKYQYDSWIAKKLMGKIDNTTIFRVDKNLMWELSHNNKKYLECPLGGCTGNLLAQFKKTKNEDKKEDQLEYDPSDDSTCKLSLGENKFIVTETGQTRTISGYKTKEYRATWLVEYEDEKGHKDKNTLRIVFWNTEPTAALEEVWSINEEATRAYRNAIKKEDNPLSSLLSDELFGALSAFSGDSSKENKEWNNSVSQKLATIKGYPISIKVDWNLDRNACMETQVAETTKKKSLGWSNPLGALQDSVGEFAANKVKDMFVPDPNEPIFHYVYEINNVAIKPVHDSVFEIPAGYTLTTSE